MVSSQHPRSCVSTDDDDFPSMPVEEEALGELGADHSQPDHPLNDLANTAMDKGEKLLAKAKETAAPLLEGANAGIQVGVIAPHEEPCPGKPMVDHHE